jgi:hypothetical protein
MKIVQNFDKIRNLLHFDGKSVYLIWLVRRNKDGNTDAKGNNKNRTIKSYYIQTREQYDKSLDEIVGLCDTFHCRAYICLNRKPLKNILFEMQINLTALFRQAFDNQPIGLKGFMDSSIMKSGTNDDKRWVIDVDSKSDDDLLAVRNVIKQCQSKYAEKEIDLLYTAHGYHIITYPFNLQQFQTLMKLNKLEADVKKEGLTLLYACLNED